MRRAACLLLLPFLALAGCGDDDGGSVTSSGAGSGSASASGSGSGSGSGSASAAPEGCAVEGGTGGAGDATLDVVLSEWAIVAADEVAAGAVTFEAVNEGEEPHELVLVRGAGPDELEIGHDGLDEEALPDGAEVVGEIEPFPGGETCSGTFELEPGDYALVCNIVDDHGHGAHAAEGMVAGLTVS